MITGVVTAMLEATIRLVLRGAGGQPRQIEAIIDTGFSGFLTLSPAVIASLGLAWLGRELGILANASAGLFDVYQIAVFWEGQQRIVEVDAIDADPLLGTALLQGYEVRIQVVDGGQVIIAPLP